MFRNTGFCARDLDFSLGSTNPNYYFRINYLTSLGLRDNVEIIVVLQEFLSTSNEI